MKRALFFIFLFALFLAADIASKYYVLHELSTTIFSHPRNAGIPVFGFFGIDLFIGLTFNKGAAWGLFANFNTLLVAVRIAIAILLFVYMLKQRKYILPIVMILAGAVGNILDFFVYGYVIDFIHFKFWGHSFPLFNIADALISIGVLLLFINLYLHKKDARI
ncbi:MAG: Lipoprotein signal peptidase [Chlamydiales bacterium]|nr:Lipoprotein signal peptidase [Chlamydiales bacterium]MCH9635621.1 Lipoprotein signal peptidase [Chlamydiales bacterium]